MNPVVRGRGLMRVLGTGGHGHLWVATVHLLACQGTRLRCQVGYTPSPLVAVPYPQHFVYFSVFVYKYYDVLFLHHATERGPDPGRMGFRPPPQSSKLAVKPAGDAVRPSVGCPPLHPPRGRLPRPWEQPLTLSPRHGSSGEP